MKRARGFTLVELLVAISILAIVAVLGWRGLDGIVRARQALSVQMENTRGMQLAFAQMQSDCDHIVDSEVLHGRQNLVADASHLVIVRAVDVENEPVRLQVVAYRIADGVLTRRESNTTRDLLQLETVWKAMAGDSDSIVPVVLQKGVSAMVVQVFDNKSWHVATTPSNAAAPVARAAPGPGTSPLVGNSNAPAGLEVALQLQGMEQAMTKVFLLGGA